MTFFVCCFLFFFFKQKTAYEMRISDWSSDVCSSDLHRERAEWQLDEHMCDRAVGDIVYDYARRLPIGRSVFLGDHIDDLEAQVLAVEIGRASCREGVCQYV